MECGVVCLAAAQKQKCETVMRAGKLWLDLERAAIAAYRLVWPASSRIRDRHVLKNAVIRRLIPESERVRRQRGLVIALTFEREALAEIVEALLLVFRLPAAEATPE